MSSGTDDPLVSRLRAAVRDGDLDSLRQLLAEHPELATARLAVSTEMSKSSTVTALHLCVDWPGRFPAVDDAIKLLCASGADPNARCEGPHDETPLMWAATCDDLDAIDALFEAGADLELTGAVIGGGTALADAVAFRQWLAARRLVQHGAVVTPAQAAALGMRGQLQTAIDTGLSQAALDVALWYAAHGGQAECAELLQAAGASPSWPSSWDGSTSAEAAAASGFPELAARLREATS